MERDFWQCGDFCYLRGASTRINGSLGAEVAFRTLGNGTIQMKLRMTDYVLDT
jgi:hypothetical protein